MNWFETHILSLQAVLRPHALHVAVKRPQNSPPKIAAGSSPSATWHYYHSQDYTLVDKAAPPKR
jgi:hypothetical protein